MAGTEYQVGTEGSVALAAATAKVILAILAPATYGIDLKGWKIAFDGVTASALPVLAEILRFTTDGTGTSVTPTQMYGRTIAHGLTAAKKDYSAAPTGVTVVEGDLWLEPNKGIHWFDYPLGDEPDCAASEGMAIRLTAPAIVNVRAQMKWARL